MQTIWSTRRRLPPGPRTIVWRPARSTPDRTYLVRLAVAGANGEPSRLRLRAAAAVSADERAGRPRAGNRRRLPRPQLPGRRRRRPSGSRPTPSACGCSSSRSRACRSRPCTTSAPAAWRSRRPCELAWPTRGSTVHYVQISAAGVAASGLYFLRVNSGDGRVGYAPLILRPRTLGEHRVAVVLSTNTWQAYNFLDANGDGWGDSWYVGGANPTVDLRRPFLDFGVPFRFKRLGPQLHLVAQSHRQAGRLPLRRRPRARAERRRTAARVRPRRLPRP